MANFEHLIHCKKVDILDEDDHILCSAEVDSGPLNSLLVVLPRSFDYNTQDSFKTRFYDPVQGLVLCRSQFSSPRLLSATKVSLRCTVIQGISQENRRSDLKIPIIYNTYATVLPKTEMSMIPSNEIYPAELVNISAGGVYIKLPVLLFRYRRIAFNFDVDGKEIPLVAEILRVENRSDDSKQPMFGYGCRFVDLSAQHESLLRSFILRRERILHEKK